MKTIKPIKFVGSSYEVGQAIGGYYRQWHQDLSQISINRQTLAKQLAIYQKFFPSLIEEVRGISNATGGGCRLPAATLPDFGA